MIDLYTWTTPNGHKVHIMLEEIGLEYTAHPINIGKGDQFGEDFLKISPNNKIPAMVDQDGPNGKPYAMFESGAMLIYLAEKTGRLLPEDTVKRHDVMQWLMFQMASVGPMLGQAHHFNRYAPEKIEYAVKRYENEANRIYGVMDRRLAEHKFLAGNDYSIADIATWPWLRSAETQGVNIDDYPNVRRWFEMIGDRDNVKAGLRVLQDHKTDLTDNEAFENMFGNKQYEKR
ncbi:glutathione S-transferase [Salinisphaera orenii MK-B5]|uniref:Glutathione S-transferase n=2 Tax=Salinisphaera orenii TaxID=856731 RepID=A0A423PPU6_9GAMM|nr:MULTISPECIES: glutathione binding-like protein [Salinisphaera]ROO27635.1 glutathione S-transferase [Salinisphaera orenii MK-B5]ROO37510.1 glutathione S-transferase [Salinisphaera halophila YIM 95161]